MSRTTHSAPDQAAALPGEGLVKEFQCCVPHSRHVWTNMRTLAKQRVETTGMLLAGVFLMGAPLP